MVGEGGDLSLIVLDEPELATGELLEEVRFGFGKDRESAKQDAVCRRGAERGPAIDRLRAKPSLSAPSGNAAPGATS